MLQRTAMKQRVCSHIRVAGSDSRYAKAVGNAHTTKCGQMCMHEE